MSKKQNKRAGEKFIGTHTTIIPGTGSIVDFITKSTYVKKVSLGYINMLCRRSSAGLAVKCIESSKGEGGETYLKVKIAFGCGTQEIHVYLHHAGWSTKFQTELADFVATLK